MIQGFSIKLMLIGLDSSTKVIDASGLKSSGGKRESSYSSFVMRSLLWDASLDFF